MNDYEALMQAAEPLRRYLEAHCGLTTEILVSRDRVDVLRCEFGIPFCRMSTSSFSAPKSVARYQSAPSFS